MANLIRWDPICELDGMHNAVDRLFEDSFLRPFPASIWENSSPSMDMFQTEDSITIKMALPGVKPEDVQVSVTNGVLSIQGEIKEEKEKTYHLRERRFGSFSRSMTLPIQANVDKSTADFENGILTLTLPKAEETKGK